MLKGYSLERDLKKLINNPKYSDVEILCEDGKKLSCSKAILAARSEVFDGLLFNGMKETYENRINFSTINSSIMEIVIEYIYTGNIEEDHLTKDNIIEAFFAAEYFQIDKIRSLIVQTIINILENFFNIL